MDEDTDTAQVNPIGILIWLVLLCCLWWAFTSGWPMLKESIMQAAAAGVDGVTRENSHAEQKHGSVIVLSVTSYLACHGGPTMTWASKNRFAEVCQLEEIDDWMENQDWGIRIIDKATGEEITIFCETCGLQALEDYLGRTGYVLISP